MYQFWLNTDDADVIDRLKVFTFLTRAEIAKYEKSVAEEPFKREAQRRLALEVTELVHSKLEAESARDASLALFGSGDLASLDEKTLSSALAELPSAKLPRGAKIIEALVATGLVESNSEARRAIEQGAVSVNKVKIASEDEALEPLASMSLAFISKGKKNLAGVFFSG
jgi:tyrosyl-tRNA synthetase